MLITFSIKANVSIHGKILDEENQPVEFVTIRISGTAIGTTSDLNGDYSISCAEQDTIKIIYSCIGFKEETRQLINPKGDITLNMKMLVETYNLGEIQVTEYKTDFISVMPTNLYGPNDNYHPTHSHVLPALIRRFHEAKEVALNLF